MTDTVLREKSDAGIPHARFDEGEVAPAAMSRRRFLVGGAATAAGVCGVLGMPLHADGSKQAPAAPDVMFNNLQTVKMLNDGGRVYALSSRIDSISLSTVFVSPEGKILVVDGGHLDRGADGRFLGDFLSKLGGHVDYWFITHAHEDHFGALVTMAEHPGFYGVTIGELIYDFPDRKWMESLENDMVPHFKRFYACLDSGSLKNVKHGDCSPGRIVKFGSWSFEILNAPFLVKCNPINNASVMISVQAGGKTWLETGDMGVEGGQAAMKKLGDRLKHDVVFLAHHGQNGVDKDFYSAVRPEAAIWPTTSWLWENNRNGRGPGSGPWRTNYVKCWMQDLGVGNNYVLVNKDYLFT